MFRHARLLPLLFLLVLAPTFAFAQSNTVVNYKKTATDPGTAVSPGNPLPVAITEGSSGVTTTTANSTIASTNVFQSALAASTTRKSCLLQNTGTHTEYIYFGTLGSATTGNSFQLSAGQSISCATVNGLVLTDAVNISGTSGDGYVVASQ